MAREWLTCLRCPSCVVGRGTPAITEVAVNPLFLSITIKEVKSWGRGHRTEDFE
jgi:hypothetical protein